ncbi:beta family protein, partial [bacterium]|nr:beta family protein [bacterium]
MFDHKHYVPVLRGKEGEFRALEHLRPNTRRNLTPFIDIPRRDLDLITNQPKDRIDVYLKKKAQKIHKAWGTRRQIFVDLFDLDLDLRIPSGTHFVQFLFSRLRNHDVRAIPVTGLDRDDDYNTAVEQIISVDKRGVAIRLQKEDIEASSSTQADIRDLLADLNMKEKDVHLVLDFRELQRNDLAQKVYDAIEFLINLADLKEWKTLSLAASGFPEHMGEVQKHSSQLIPRTELDLWEQVLTELKKKNLTRFPAFSDYGTRSPPFY